MQAKVLAVDDRRENLIALEAIMQGLPLETVSVTSGEEALKKLLIDDYAVILLDAHMPGMDGFQTAEHIKQRERTRHIPIIFLTAVQYDTHLAFRGYQAGAVDYLTKPFDPWMLRSKVAVFVDLWRMNAELSERAAECDKLRATVDTALDVLESCPSVASSSSSSSSTSPSSSSLPSSASSSDSAPEPDLKDRINQAIAVLSQARGAR